MTKIDAVHNLIAQFHMLFTHKRPKRSLFLYVAHFLRKYSLDTCMCVLFKKNNKKGFYLTHQLVN